MDDGLRRVYVEPTNRCNLNCAICMRRVWEEPVGDMSLPDFRRIAGQLKRLPQLECISFGGYGEPLLHPEIVEMVARAKAVGVEVHLITNGCLLDREMGDSLLQAGLDRILVSFDGASEPTHDLIRGESQFRLVKENMVALRRLSTFEGRREIAVDIEFVATRRNVADLPRLRGLAMSIGAGNVIVNNLLPHTEEMKDQILYGRYMPSSFSPKDERWNPHLCLPKMDIDERNSAPILELLRTYPNMTMMGARLWAGANHCRFVHEGCAAISWDGSVSPCLALMHSYPCYVLGRKKQIHKCVLGRLPDEKIADVWQSKEYRELRRRVVDFQFPPCPDCGACELIESNLEDCLGNPFPVCGDCLWAQGILQCP